MNYIAKLQSQVAERDADTAAYDATLRDLRVYLMSDKFHNDPTVQVRDVLHRIDQGFHHYRYMAKEA